MVKSCSEVADSFLLLPESSVILFSEIKQRYDSYNTINVIVRDLMTVSDQGGQVIDESWDDE